MKKLILVSLFLLLRSSLYSDEALAENKVLFRLTPLLGGGIELMNLSTIASIGFDLKAGMQILEKPFGLGITLDLQIAGMGRNSHPRVSFYTKGSILRGLIHS